MSIASNCMVVNLQVGLWTAHRLDKEASRRVTTEASAHDDAARVNKHLIPKEALKPIVSSSNMIRSHFYDKTLPWKDNGDRLLTRKMYMPFIEEHERLVGIFNSEVEEFLATSYPAAIAKAEFRMGTLFRDDDYPPAATLRRRFYAHLDIDPVSEAGDFRVTMDKSEQKLIQKRIEAATEQRIAGAMQDVWTRLAKTVGHFADKMKSEDTVFRNSTVHNLEELVQMLPALNILDDPDLNKIYEELAEHVVGYQPDELRKDAVVRSNAAEQSARIMKDMEGFMNAFGKAA